MELDVAGLRGWFQGFFNLPEAWGGGGGAGCARDSSQHLLAGAVGGLSCWLAACWEVLRCHDQLKNSKPQKMKQQHPRRCFHSAEAIVAWQCEPRARILVSW